MNAPETTIPGGWAIRKDPQEPPVRNRQAEMSQVVTVAMWEANPGAFFAELMELRLGHPPTPEQVNEARQRIYLNKGVQEKLRIILP